MTRQGYKKNILLLEDVLLNHYKTFTYQRHAISHHIVVLFDRYVIEIHSHDNKIYNVYISINMFNLVFLKGIDCTNISEVLSIIEDYEKRNDEYLKLKKGVKKNEKTTFKAFQT